MGAGVRTPTLLRGSHGLTALALVAACWLATPADASSLLPGGEAPTVDSAAPALSVAAPPTGANLSMAGPAGPAVNAATDGVSRVVSRANGGRPAVDVATGRVSRAVSRPDGARPAAGSAARRVSRAVSRPDGARPAVEAAAQGASGAVSRADGAHPALEAAARGASAVVSRADGARPALEGAIRGASGAAGSAVDTGVGGPAAGVRPAAKTIGPVDPGAATRHVPRAAQTAAGNELARVARLQLRLVGSERRSHPASPAQPPAAATEVPTANLLVASRGPTPTAGSVHAALDALSSPDPASTAVSGSSASGAGAGFGLGGLAVLMATLSLAGPALRRRLSTFPAGYSPAAFVPLLERPG